MVSKKTDLRSKDDEELSDVFLFSSKSLMGPFESATLHHYQLDEENLHVLISKTNHESQLFINEQDMGKADDFVQLSDDGRSVYLRKYNALYNVNKRKFNATVSSLGSEEFTFLTDLPSSEIAMDDKAYSLLMRLKSNKLSLQHGSVISDTTDFAWDLQSQQSDAGVEWSWLAGDINMMMLR